MTAPHPRMHPIEVLSPGAHTMCNSDRRTSDLTRRTFLQTGSMAAAVAGIGMRGRSALAFEAPASAALTEFGYGDVSMASEAHESQLMNTHSVLMNLSEDSILKPLRQMSGMPAPGEDLGGWANYDPDYDYRAGFDEGFAPACTFGQWVSALARVYAITGDEETRQKVLRLNRLYAETISADFYIKNRFPAYTYDKLLLGLLDSHTYVKDRRRWRSSSTPPIPLCRTFPATLSNMAFPGAPTRTPKTSPGPGTSPTPSRRISSSRRSAVAVHATMTSLFSTWTTSPGTIPSRATRTCSTAATPTAMSTRSARP